MQADGNLVSGPDNLPATISHTFRLSGGSTTELVASFSPKQSNSADPSGHHQGSPICEGTVRTFSDASPTPCRPPCPGSLCQPHPRRFPSSIFSLSLQAPLFRFFSLPSVATGKSLKQTENTPELRSARPLPLCLPRDFLELPLPKNLVEGFRKAGPSLPAFPPPP